MCENATAFEATILAKGAPVQKSDGERVMCAIAVSPQLGLVRLYPLKVSEDVCVWSKVAVVARRSNKDNRRESWRVIECEPIGKVSDSPSKRDLLEACILKSGTIPPTKYQNDVRASICIVKPKGPLGMSLEPRCDEDFCEHDPEESWVYTQNEMPYKPYVIWRSVQGSEHKSHVVAQEAYMGMLNNSACPSKVFDNMRIGDPDYEHWLVLGNMKDKRNIWLVPHIHRLKKTASRTLSSLLINNGSGDAWPYLTQEEVNAKDAGRQPMLPFIM